MRIKVSGGQFFADGFPIRKGFELQDGREKTLSCLSDKGAGCALLRVAGGIASLTGGGIELVRWKQGAALRPLPKREEIVRRRSFSERGFFLQVALRAGRRSSIAIAGAATYEREIPLSDLARYLLSNIKKG